MKKIILLTLFLILVIFLSFVFLLKPQTSPKILKFNGLTPFQFQPPSITLVAVGDVMLGRSVNARMKQLKDFQYPFLKTEDFLKSADLTFGNLEAPFFQNCPTTNTGMIFCADPQAIIGLKESGFDVLSLANNHSQNYGDEGFNQTLNILSQEKIIPLVESQEKILTVKGTKLGFLAFNLLENYSQEKILEKISQTKKESDLLIISLHWGNEYAAKPTQKQIELAHQMIDKGVDLILGHHPHVIQPTEEYQGKLIVYSMGNFVFDQFWSEETQKGLVGRFTFEDKKLVKKEFWPVNLKNSQPEIEE